MNLPGTFLCSCKPGFAGNGITCADIDECALGTANCDANATCNNTQGSFTCSCKAGFTGDGVTCACAGSTVLCGASCVDTQSDANHCGGCDGVCASDQDCVSGACVGSGNLQFSAVWSRPGDGDLLVTTPNGNTIWWSNPGPNAGTDFGQMDKNDMAGTGPENVFWDTGATPPSGTYHVCFETAAFSPAPDGGNPVMVTATVQIPQQSPQTFDKTVIAPTSINGSCDPAFDSYLGSITYP
jgi:hypothetical protein